MGSRARVLLFIGATVLGLGLLILLVRPPAPLPAPAPPTLAQDYSDPDEDAVMQIEEMMLDVAAQLKRKAWGGVIHHVAQDFEGSSLLRMADGPPKTVGGVRLRTGGPDSKSLDRAGFRKSLEDIDLDDVVFKFPAATLSGETLKGRMKIDAKRERGVESLRWVSQGDVEFARRDGRWVLRRFHSAEIRTEEGARRFVDATIPLGLPITPGEDGRARGTITFGRLFLGGIAAGDFDGDGLVDLYVPQVGQDLLFRNVGGKFVECARDLGIVENDAGAGALFVDVDNDGLLDLLVTNYEPQELRDKKTSALTDNAGHRALALYRNVGGKFVDVTEKAGLTCRGTAMSVCAADVNGDG